MISVYQLFKFILWKLHFFIFQLYLLFCENIQRLVAVLSGLLYFVAKNLLVHLQHVFNLLSLTDVSKSYFHL